MDHSKLDALIVSRRDELISDMKRWIAVPSLLDKPAKGAPFGKDVKRMLDIAVADAKRYGFITRDFDGYCCDISMGEGEKTMGILCHLDVVPAGDGWTHEPFSLSIDNGVLYGRGVVDNKGPALCAMHAMRAVRDSGIELKDGVRLILGCDEETGMTDMEHYKAHVDKLPDYGFSPDAEYPVINIEKGSLGVVISKRTGGEEGAELPVYSLYAGERPNVVPGVAYADVGVAGTTIGELSLKLDAICAEMGFNLTAMLKDEGTVTITASGQAAHASMPHLGVNAAGMLLITLDKLGAGGGSRGAIEALAKLLGLEGDGGSLGIAINDELSGALTCNLGMLWYDGDELTARLDIRYPLNADETHMLGVIAMNVSPYGLSVSRVSGHVPHHVPKEHKIVRGLIKAYENVTGKEGFAFAIGGGTYSRCMPNTVAFGPIAPGEVDTCHMPDECVSIDALMEDVRIMAHAIAELASGDID